MMRTLDRRIVAASQRLVPFGTTLAVALVSFAALMGVARAFSHATHGLLPFDLQHQLTVPELLAQLELYADRSYALYSAFLAIDMVFPLASGVVFAALVAFGLRIAWPRAHAGISARSLWPLLLVATAFDWMENIAGFGLILFRDGDRHALAAALVAAKRAKLASLAMLWVATASVLLCAGAVVAWRALRMRGSHPGR
jgi:hypothetical protein